MNILLIGASGTIGRAVAAQLASKHRVVTASRNDPDNPLELTDSAALERLLQEQGPFDAVINTGGKVTFGRFSELGDEDWQHSLQSKLLGQVNLLRVAVRHLADNGSVTLTSGHTDERPVRGSSIPSTVNGALHAMVRAAALDLPRGIRVNAVSPGNVAESPPGHNDYFPGFDQVGVEQVARAYVRSIEGADNGTTYKVY